MRFLIDECLPSRLGHLLTACGHDVAHVLERGFGGCPDTDVLAVAKVEERVLVSADTDFGELLARSSAPRPSVILFRRKDKRAEVLASVLLASLSDLEDELEQGALVVVGDERLRIRRLPLT